MILQKSKIYEKNLFKDEDLLTDISDDSDGYSGKRGVILSPKNPCYYSNGFCRAAEKNYKDLIAFFMPKCTPDYFSVAMMKALEKGHKDLGMFFYNKCKEYNVKTVDCYTMEYLARSGNIEMIDFFLQEGCKSYFKGMRHACWNATHVNIFEYFYTLKYSSLSGEIENIDETDYKVYVETIEELNVEYERLKKKLARELFT